MLDYLIPKLFICVFECVGVWKKQKKTKQTKQKKQYLDIRFYKVKVYSLKCFLTRSGSKKWRCTLLNVFQQDQILQSEDVLS